MLKNASFKIVLASLLFIPNVLLCTSRVTLNYNNEKLYGLMLDIEVATDDYLYIDYLTISTDHPDIEVDPWETYTPRVTHFDSVFNADQKAFNQNTSLWMALRAPNFNTITNANLHVSYYLKSKGKIVEDILPLSFKQHDLETQIDLPAQQTVSDNAPQDERKNTNKSEPDKVQTTPKKTGWLDWISQTVEHSDSLIVQWLLVFLLGLLMSLTPCIYPMVPITAGILQSQGSKSIIMSFLLAFSYTLGIATTFSILGLLAAFAGQAMGQFMYHPAFIIPMVLLLIYLAFSMIGLYDMYVPRFLQPRDHQVNGGSFISVFIFGALSGIVASPCLSPGLLCLLCIVSTLGSKLVGFILLFAFGVGLSVPLLVIGTFSSSLSLLPRAGMWMVEVKKIFGFVMLGMCFYFLDPILPWAVKAILIPLFIAIIGIYYLYHARSSHSKALRIANNILGILIIAASVLATAQAFFAWQYRQGNIDTFWNTNYQAALQEAQQSHKALFVDIGAPSCSICKAIDKTLFADMHVRVALKSYLNTIPVKIDGSDPANATIMQQFKVIGFPTILLINAETQQVIKQWGPELYGMDASEFVDQAKNALK